MINCLQDSLVQSGWNSGFNIKSRNRHHTKLALQLAQIIRSSPFIHIDETTVRLAKGKDKGYVWAFATTHTVFYHLMLTPWSRVFKRMAERL